MKQTLKTLRKTKLTILLLALLPLLLSACQLQDSYSGKVILDGAHELADGQTLDGDLLVLGGEMDLRAGSQVSGSVHVLDGSVRIAGEVGGNATVLNGQLALLPRAVVRGDLTSAGGTLETDPSAQVLGQVRQSVTTGEPRPDPQAGRWLTLLLELPLLSGFAYLVMRYLPRHVAVMGQAATRYILPSGALGLLGWVVGLSLLVLMAYTILLIPVSLLGFFALLGATSFGAVPYALGIGRWITHRFDWALSAPAAAALGMALLVILVELVRLIPGIGGLLPLAFLLPALGAALLTRFGLRPFVPPNPDLVHP